MPNRITQDQERQYIAERGVCCPFCHSSSISGKAVDIDNGIASQEIDCDDCGENWTDLYTLTGTTTEYTDPVFHCKGCGREEGACSADPCPGVIADRAESGPIFFS